MKKTIKIFLAVIFSVISISAFALSANSDTAVKLGDVDNNGKIDAFDYLQLKRAYLGTAQLDEGQMLRGDCNQNNKIDIMDYILLKRAYFGTFSFQDTDPNSPENDGPVYEDDGYYNEVIKP